MLAKIIAVLVGGKILQIEIPTLWLVVFYVLLLAVCFWGRLTGTVIIAAIVMFFADTINWWGHSGSAKPEYPIPVEGVTTITYFLPLLAIVVGLNVEIMNRFRKRRQATDAKVKGWLLTPLLAVALVALLLTILDHFIIGMVVFGLGVVFEVISFIQLRYFTKETKIDEMK